MNNFENFSPEEPEIEKPASLEKEENVLEENIEGLKEELLGVDPEKLSSEDWEYLGSKTARIMNLLGGLGGLGIGSIEAINSILGKSDSPEKLIASVLFALSGGATLIALNRRKK